MKITGICSHCERRRSEIRPLRRGERPLVWFFMLYALAAIVPDFLRLVPGRVQAAAGIHIDGWLPLGSLGFEANNDGKVTHVDQGGPATDRGIAEDDLIDLKATKRSERRAVNQFVFVKLGETHTIVFKQPARQLDLEPAAEKPGWWSAVGLLAAQVSAVFFILLSAWIVLHLPALPTWGLFLYALWFNSGQYFFWYANLPDPWLCGFNVIQAILESLGLVGILMFAIFFPRHPVEGWRRIAGRSLPFLFVVFLGVRIWAFGNYFWGMDTEFAYRLWYALTAITLLVIFGLLRHTHNTHTEYQTRVDMVTLGATIGLLAWLTADTFETIGFPTWNGQPDWNRFADGIDLLFAVSVVFPLSMYYCIVKFRVIDVRFAIHRGVVVTMTLGAVYLLYAFFHPTLEVMLKKNVGEHNYENWWLLFGAIVSLVIVFFENKTHEWVHRILFPGWHRTAEHLRSVTDELAHSDDIRSVSDVDAAVLNLPVAELELKCGAIYTRRESGAFHLDHEYGLEITCDKCGHTKKSKLAPLSEHDAIFQKLTARHESSTNADSKFPKHRDGKRDWSHVSKRRRRRAAKHGAEIDLDWSRNHGTPDRTTPAYAIPILRRQGDQHVVSRVIVYGPHASDADIDSDEIKVLEALCAAAGRAYYAVEVEAWLSSQSMAAVQTASKSSASSSQASSHKSKKSSRKRRK